MEPVLKQSFLISMLNHGQTFPTQALTWERYQEKGLTALKNVLYQYNKTYYSPQTFCLSCMPGPYGSNKHCPHLLWTAALPASPFAICQHHNVWFLFLICSRSLSVKAVKYWNSLPLPCRKVRVCFSADSHRRSISLCRCLLGKMVNWSTSGFWHTPRWIITLNIDLFLNSILGFWVYT